MAFGSSEIFEEGDADLLGCGFGRGERNGQNGIGAHLFLVLRAIKTDHRLVDGDLVERVHSHEFGREDFLNVGDRLGHALSQIYRLNAVAKLPGLVLSGGGSAGHGGAPQGASCEFDVGFYGWIAARVNDLAGYDGCNEGIGHGCGVFSVVGSRNSFARSVASRFIVPRRSGRRGLRERMNFLVESGQICKGFDSHDFDYAATGFRRQLHTLTGRLPEKRLPDNRLVGYDPQVRRTVPRAEDGVSLLIAL